MTTIDTKSGRRKNAGAIRLSRDETAASGRLWDRGGAEIVICYDITLPQAELDSGPTDHRHGLLLFARKYGQLYTT